MYGCQVWSSGFLREGDVFRPTLQTLQLNFLKGTLGSRQSSRRRGTWDGKSIIHPLWVWGSNLTGGHNRLSCPRSADTALKPYLTLKGTLGVKRSVPNWAVLRECAHEPLQFYWFRAPFGFTTGSCPPIVPLLSRSFMQTWSWCLGLKHLES